MRHLLWLPLLGMVLVSLPFTLLGILARFIYEGAKVGWEWVDDFHDLLTGILSKPYR